MIVPQTGQMIGYAVNKASKEKQAIDLFSGMGGLSLGLHYAGWEVIAGFEYDKAAVECYKEGPKERVSSAFRR